MNATPLYVAIIEQMRRQILARDWTMWRCDERSGVQDGYTAKMLHPNTPSGRQARWHTLQDLLDALYPKGVTVRLTQLCDQPPLEVVYWDKIQAALDVFFPHGVEVGISPASDVVHPVGSIPVLLSQGSRDASAKMNLARSAKLSPSRRSRIARRAARTRWRKARERAYSQG